MVIQKLLNLDKSETVILEVKRHPIGVWALYAFGIIVTGVFLGLLYFSIVNIEDSTIGISQTAYTIVFSFLIVFFLLLTYVGITVYKANELIVTNENIIQVLQFGPLNRQVSQLNLAKIQDVSVDEVGLLAQTFGYGVLEIETAGEASNFKFRYTPKPNNVAKTIIEAHEDFVRRTHTPPGQL